jgi:hypothetical protein
MNLHRLLKPREFYTLLMLLPSLCSADPELVIMNKFLVS